MSDKAFRQLIVEVRDACTRYLNAIGSAPPWAATDAAPPPAKAKKTVRQKGNPICKCGHGFTVHGEPRDNAAGQPLNICRGCDADGSKIGCPEFVSKRGKPPSANGAAMSVAANEFTTLEMAVLAALKANHHTSWTAQKLAILTVYVQSGTFNSSIANLRDLGLIEGSPELWLTHEGRQVAVDVGTGYDAVTLRDAWAKKQGKLGARVIQELARSKAESSAQLAERCGYVQSGTFNSMIAKMRRMGLIEEKLPLRLCPELL